MHRDDKSKYLLYIEPTKEEKLAEPIEDSLTELMKMAITKAQKGGVSYSKLDDMGDGTDFTWRDVTHRVPSFHTGSMYKGVHRTDCGEHSTNCDFLLENAMITNSLATFYVRWYRNSITENDLNKLKELVNFYK